MTAQARAPTSAVEPARELRGDLADRARRRPRARAAGSSPSHSSSSSSNVGIARLRVSLAVTDGRLCRRAQAPRRARRSAAPLSVHWCPVPSPRNAREIPYTVRRSTRARQGARERPRADRRRGRAAGARPRARRGGGRARAAPVDRAAPGRGARACWRGSPPARARVPYLGATLELVPEAGRTRVHRRGRAPARARRRRPPGARALLPPRSAHRDRAATGSRRRARRRRLHASWTSARSARAGRRARRTGG